MKLILVRAGHDKFSYTPLSQEHISIREDDVADANFHSLLRDYTAWLKKGGGSIIELTLYKLNEKTGEMSVENRIVEKGELRKRVVVNPELAEYRNKNGKSPIKKPSALLLAQIVQEEDWLAQVQLNQPQQF